MHSAGEEEDGSDDGQAPEGWVGENGAKPRKRRVSKQRAVCVCW